MSENDKRGARRLLDTYFRPTVRRHLARQNEPDYLEALRKRQIWCEGTFAAQKWGHNLTRVLRRGLEAAEDHCLLSATALNLKRPPQTGVGCALTEALRLICSLPIRPMALPGTFWDVQLPLPELWEAVKWAVKPDGAVLFFAQCPYDKVLGASNLSMLRYEWVWYKSRCTGFLNARRAPLKRTEKHSGVLSKIALLRSAV